MARAPFHFDHVVEASPVADVYATLLSVEVATTVSPGRRQA